LLAYAELHLGVIRLKQERWEEAGELLGDARRIMEQEKVESWIRYYIDYNLGTSVLGQKNYDAAESTLVKAYEELRQREAELSRSARTRLAHALERVIRLYEAAGRSTEAARWRKELETLKIALKVADSKNP
jgi:hypothetical protein